MIWESISKDRLHLGELLFLAFYSLMTTNVANHQMPSLIALTNGLFTRTAFVWPISGTD